MIKPWDGKLYKKAMNMAEFRAYKSYWDQYARCYNKNQKYYKHYGGKGVEVKYKIRDFMGWYLYEYNKKNEWKRPNVGRINHDGHYEFGNIELIECSENVKERNARLGTPSYKKRILITLNGIESSTRTLSDAAKFIGVHYVLVGYWLRGTRKIPNKRNLKVSYLSKDDRYDSWRP